MSRPLVGSGGAEGDGHDAEQQTSTSLPPTAGGGEASPTGSGDTKVGASYADTLPEWDLVPRQIIVRRPGVART